MNPTEDRNAALDAISFKLESPEPQQEEVETPIDPEVQAEADMRLAEGGPSAMQQLQGLGIEMGGTIAGTYATTKALQTQKVAKGLSLLKNIRRAGQTVAAAGTLGPQAVEPVSTIGGLVTFGVTEAVWAAGSNFVKQEYFKALGVQEETSGGELLASALLVGPLISQGRKIPKLGQVFDTAMINSRKWRVGAHMVQGSIIGSVESSIRQTFDIMADEDANIGDFSMTDFFTGAAGGAAFGGALGLGSDTIGLIKTYRAVVARSKVEMRGSLVEKLAKLDASITKMQKMKQGGRRKVATEMRYAETKKELDQLDAVHDSIDEKLAETEAALESVNTPKEAPEAPATPKEAPEVPEFKIETDNNPNYTKGGYQKKVLGYKVTAKDGNDYYIEANSENPKDGRFVVYKGDGGYGIGEAFDAFPTKRDAVEFLQSKDAPATPQATPQATPAPKKEYKIESIFDEDGEIDFDADEALRKIAKERDLGITGDREANSVVRNEDGEVIGGTFVSNDGDNYTFDVVVSETADGTGVGSKLLDDVIEMPYELRDMNPDATMQVDVVSPKMKEMLERRGFEVKEEIGKDRWLMEPKDYDNVGKPKVVETTPAPKTPEVAPEATPFKDYKESEAYAEEIGGLGINRSPRVDASLVDLTDEALKTQKRQAEKTLDKLESGKMETRKEVDEVAAAQDRLSEFENEEFRRRFKVNIDEYKAAASDEERAEIMDFIKSELFDDIGRSKDEEFKLAFLLDQLSKEGLFNDFMVANKRELQAKIDADPEFQASYEEVFKGDLLDKLNRGKALLEDASSVRLESKIPETPIKPQDVIDGPTISTPALEATPKTPFQALMDDYDAAIAEQSQGRGADQIVSLNKHFNAISDDFAKKADALVANPNAESVDDLLSMLDEYTAFDAKDAELKQKTGQGSRAQGRDSGDADFEREKMSPERQIRNDALKEVREKLQAMKDDVDGAEMQKLVDDIFTYPEPVKGKNTRTPSPDEAFMPPPKDGEAPIETPKGETKAPKKSSRERSIDRLQKKLDELRAIRSGEKDTKNPKPKKAKSAEEKDLEERIKFYQGESKEVADIASTQERIQVLSGLIQGNSQSQIRQQIGLPPKLLPAHAKPKKIETTLTKLKAQEAKLMKILRRKQTDAILSDMRNVFDPSHESRSIVDKALNGYLMARTDALLNQPSTATTGLLSGAIQTVWRPLINTGRNTIQALNPADRALKGVPMTGRMKYAAADVLATADQLLTFAQSPIVTTKQALRNTYETFKQGGSSAYFYKDANKIDVRDDAINAGNSTILNSRKVIQGDIRAKANEQKSVIVSKAMKLMGSDPMTALMAFAKMGWSAGRSGVGALDEPFNLILEGRGHRADAIKEAIKQKVKPEEVAGFIDDYVKKAGNVDAQGIKRFNYLDNKYRNSANQTRRGLFRPADLEKGDPRALMEEHLVSFFRSASGGDLTAGKLLFRFLQPIITTPTIALAQQGRTVARATGIPAAVDIGQRVYAGGAKRVGKKGKISNVMSGGINKQINDLEMTVEDLRAKTKEKGLDLEEQKKRDENLAANKEQLKSLRDYRDEQTYEKIAMMGLGMGLFYTFFEMGRQGLVTGAGAQFTRDQRNNGEFQKYRMGAGEDSEGWIYLLAEPVRFLAAFAADLGAWYELGDSRTKDQTIGNFITSTLEAYATDSVFTTSLRHMKDLAFGKEKTRTGAVIDIAAGAIPIPSAVRSARVLDDENYSVYDEGAKFSDIGSRAFDKAVGTEAENFRVDKLGRPLLRPERGALHYVFRYAPEDRAHRMTAEEEVRQVLRNDGLSYNLIPKLTEFKTINGTQVNLKEFTRKDRSLFNLFAEVVNDGDEMLHELHDLVMDDDWPLDYDNYTVEPNPDNQDELYNKGIERFKEVRQKHIDRAVDHISDESNINLFRNKDGQTVHEYIESLEERPAKSGNVLETFPNY